MKTFKVSSTYSNMCKTRFSCNNKAFGPHRNCNFKHAAINISKNGLNSLSFWNSRSGLLDADLSFLIQLLPNIHHFHWTLLYYYMTQSGKQLQMWMGFPYICPFITPTSKLSILAQNSILFNIALYNCHSLSLAPVNQDWFYENGSAFLVPAYQSCPGKKAVKRM